MSAIVPGEHTRTLPPTPEEITREYEAKLQAAARAHYTNDRLLADWWDYCQPSLSPSSRHAWEHYLKHVREYLATRSLHVLTLSRKDALDYITWLQTGDYEGRRSEPGKLAAATVHKQVQHLSLICRYLRDARGLMRADPCAGLANQYAKRHKTQLRPDLRALSEEEALQLLEAAEGLDDFTLALFLLKTGVRREECALIRMDRIDWKARTIRLEPHPKRTYLVAYFDEELEHFLRLKVERNRKLDAANPYLWPSPQRRGEHVAPDTITKTILRMVQRSSLAGTIKDAFHRITPHTARRSFTSWLKRARRTAPQGCPSHVVAALRGDSLRARSELIPDATQGIYTKFGKVEGVDELRYWYDRCMPVLGAIVLWESMTPAAWDATTVQALIRSAEAPAATIPRSRGRSSPTHGQG